MTDLLIYLSIVALNAVIIRIAYNGGARRGCDEERMRVEGLIYAALRRGRISPSLRWVLNAVSSGAHELPTEEGFFAPETKT